MGCCNNKARTIEYKDKFNYNKNFINENNIKSFNDIKLISSNLVYGSNQPFSKNYKIISSLGGGSYGKVYKCLHLLTNQIRAIKVVKIPEKKEACLDNNNNNKQFNIISSDKVFKEIELLAHLDHPHIIKIYEFYKDDYNYFISTEYLEGGDLYDYINKLKSFNEADAARIISQVISAVNYLHSKGIAHRDLKPENIVVEYNVLDSLLKDDFNKKGLKNNRKIAKEVKYENNELLHKDNKNENKIANKDKDNNTSENHLIHISNFNEPISNINLDMPSNNNSNEKKEYTKENIINIKSNNKVNGILNKKYSNKHSDFNFNTKKLGIINPVSNSPNNKLVTTSLFYNTEKNKRVHKLSNINVKIIDFGAATYFKKTEILNAKVGTPYYIAPEVLRREYNYKCDIWSLGVILYILLVGKPPFDGRSSESVFNKILSGKYDKTGNYNKISSSAKQLIHKMLNYNYRERLSCKECLESHWILSHASSITNSIYISNSLLSQECQNETPNIKGKHKFTNNTVCLTSIEEKTSNNQFDLLHKNIDIKRSPLSTSKIINDEGNKFKEALDNLKKFSNKNKFQQATIAYLVRHVANKEIFEDLREIFKTFDTDNNGTLSYEEIKAGFKKYIPSNDELELDYDDIIKQLDQDQNNNIEYEEFLRNMVDMKILLTKQNLQIAFNMFDTDKDGVLSLKEIKDALGVISDSKDFSFNNKKKKNQQNNILNKILCSMDSDGNGTISFDEFYDIMMNFIE